MATLTVAKDDVRQVSCADELATELRRLSTSTREGMPLIVTINGLHNHELGIGLYDGKAFIQIAPEGGLPPYLLSVGDESNTETIEFLFHLWHDTEIPGRHLIDEDTAIDAVADYWHTGHPSTFVKWEEI